MELIGIEKKIEISVTKIYTIFYYEFTKDYYFAGEQHNFWEIVYVDKGNVNFVIENKHYHLNQNEIIFCEPNAFHSAYADSVIPPNLLVMSFSCSDEIIRFFQRQVLKLDHEECHLLGQIISVACSSKRQDYVNANMVEFSKQLSGFGTNQLVFLYIEELLLHLIRRNSSIFYDEFYSSLTIHSIKNKPSDGITADLFNTITAYLEKNLHRSVSMEEICREFSIGCSSLRRLFQRHCSKSVIAYFNYLKIQKAKEMIRAHNTTYSQIAESLGYSSIHYFCRQFKNVSGMTPSQYNASVKAASEALLLDEDMKEGAKAEESVGKN